MAYRCRFGKLQQKRRQTPGISRSYLGLDDPPGGNVVLRAEADLFVVVTACSVGFHPTNGDRCTGINVEPV